MKVKVYIDDIGGECCCFLCGEEMPYCNLHSGGELQYVETIEAVITDMDIIKPRFNGRIGVGEVFCCNGTDDNLVRIE